MSAMSRDVVIVDKSMSLSLASGRLRPQPRWSNRVTAYRAGSKKVRHQGVAPEPGPP